jgi:hypothetical protein
MEAEERAADPLAGGILGHGYQCGMLWGSALAVGAEAFRRTDNRDQAIGTAIKATQQVMRSFTNRARSVDCMDVTGCDWTSKLSMAKYFLTGRFISCFRLVEKWAPEAIQSATEGLSREHADLPQQSMSCASEVARRMGASDEQMVMVAGFAGGLGLSGNACGALSAAIWLKTLAWCGQHSGTPALSNPIGEKSLEALYGATDYKILCHEITGKHFNTINDHTEFIRTGGCEKLIDVLARA